MTNRTASSRQMPRKRWRLSQPGGKKTLEKEVEVQQVFDVDCKDKACRLCHEAIRFW